MGSDIFMHYVNRRTCSLLCIVIVSVMILSSCATRNTFYYTQETAAQMERALTHALSTYDLEHPEEDAARNFARGDKRLIALYGEHIYCPGVEEEDDYIVAQQGMILIQGTADGIVSKEHFLLNEQARLYARAYNKSMVKRIKKDTTHWQPMIMTS